jgi:hypothetical protein
VGCVMWDAAEKDVLSHIPDLISHISFTASVSPNSVKTPLELLHSNRMNDGLANFGEKD